LFSLRLTGYEAFAEVYGFGRDHYANVLGRNNHRATRRATTISANRAAPISAGTRAVKPSVSISIMVQDGEGSLACDGPAAASITTEAKLC